jgi:hypothetical protein
MIIVIIPGQVWASEVYICLGAAARQGEINPRADS